METLKDKLVRRYESWSLSSVEEFFDFNPIATARENRIDTNKIWEWADNGLYLTSNASIRFYANDGVTSALIRDKSDPTFSRRVNDLEITNALVECSKDSTFIRFSLMVEQELVGTKQGLREFRSYRSPNNELGINLLADQYTDPNLVNDEYLKTYIDQVAWIIKTLSNLGYPLPSKCGPDKRLRDSIGYYFYDLNRFTCTHQEFCERHLNVLKILVNNELRKGVMCKIHNANLDDILEYAEKTWEL